MANTRILTLARDLEAADAALAEQIADVDELQHETDRVRDRAGELRDRLERLPEERAAAGEALARAAQALERRRATVAKADLELTELERTRDQEAVTEARRAVVRARDAASSAERKLARAEEAGAALEQQARSAANEARELERVARGLAKRLASLPRISKGGAGEPEPGLEATVDWASRANAALFVVRSGLDTERERIVRQANELAASAFGQPVSATSVSLLRERLEATLG